MSPSPPSLLWRAVASLKSAGDVDSLMAFIKGLNPQDINPLETHVGVNLLGEVISRPAAWDNNDATRVLVQQAALRLLRLGVDPFVNLDVFMAGKLSALRCNNEPLQSQPKVARDTPEVCPLVALYKNDRATILASVLARPDAPSAKAMEALRTASGLPWLHAAAECLSDETLKVLLDHGLDPCQRDDLGRTALFHCRRPSSVTLLLDAGSDASLTDNRGRNCWLEWEGRDAGTQMLGKLPTAGIQSLCAYRYSRNMSQLRGFSNKPPQGISDSPRFMVLSAILHAACTEPVKVMESSRIAKAIGSLDVATANRSWHVADLPWSKADVELALLTLTVYSFRHDQSTHYPDTVLSLWKMIPDFKHESGSMPWSALVNHSYWSSAISQTLPAFVKLDATMAMRNVSSKTPIGPLMLALGTAASNAATPASMDSLLDLCSPGNQYDSSCDLAQGLAAIWCVFAADLSSATTSWRNQPSNHDDWLTEPSRCLAMVRCFLAAKQRNLPKLSLRLDSTTTIRALSDVINAWDKNTSAIFFGLPAAVNLLEDLYTLSASSTDVRAASVTPLLCAVRAAHLRLYSPSSPAPTKPTPRRRA